MKDYQKRLVEEYKQLKERLIKLGNFIKDQDGLKSEDSVLKYSVEILKMQYNTMKSYYQVLEFLLKLEDIELSPKKRYSVAIPVGDGFYKTLVQKPSTGELVLGDRYYSSLEVLKRHNRNVPDGGLTENRIKNSSCDWAWLDGYEVEQEKLYTVEIEGVSSGKLFKNIRTNEYLFHIGNGFYGYTDKLTETEIKQKDERLWQFAKEVEE